VILSGSAAGRSDRATLRTQSKGLVFGKGGGTGAGRRRAQLRPLSQRSARSRGIGGERSIKGGAIASVAILYTWSHRAMPNGS